VLDGTVIGHCSPRHRHQEFLKFLKKLDETVVNGQQLHLVLDNYGTHKHPTVKAWLTARPNYHLHFTPTRSSWLNLVERFFAEITQRRIRRGTFSSVPSLIDAITEYIRDRNKKPKSFNWVGLHLESKVIARGLQLTEEFGRPVNGLDVFTEQIKTARHEEREWTYVRKDGSHLTVTLVVTALKDSGGSRHRLSRYSDGHDFHPSNILLKYCLLV
jgi:transposase